MVNVELQKEWYTWTTCVANPHKLYIFGDNMIGKGKGGQAIIRDISNSFGIPTKRLPNMLPGAYMSDQRDEWDAIRSKINLLKELEKDYEVFVFPADGLGTGLAKMSEKSPYNFKFMNQMLYNRYKVYGEWT